MDTVIGGDQELAALREFLTTSREGARALVLEGEAGIGKTTLWQEGLALARAQQVKVLSARPAVAESGLAHVGLGDLFDRHLDELLPAMPAPRRSALEVALLLAEAGGRPPDAGAVGVAVLTALRWLSRSGRCWWPRRHTVARPVLSRSPRVRSPPPGRRAAPPVLHAPHPPARSRAPTSRAAASPEPT